MTISSATQGEYREYSTADPICTMNLKVDLGFSPAWALGCSAHFSNQSAQSARLVVVTFCLVSLPMRLYLVSCGL